MALLAGGISMSQNVNKPNYSLKSHETLEITRIETNPQATIIYLSLENKINGGYFCADKNIFILYPDGKRSKLGSSKGIPVCPETYKFKSIGEKLNFQLVFPPLRSDVAWIDLIEECSENCISFYGICLDAELNRKIDDASVLAENGQPVKSLLEFIKIADQIGSSNSGVSGLVFMNIVELSKETGNMEKAAEWYKKLKDSGIPRSDVYIRHLNSRGIVF